MITENVLRVRIEGADDGSLKARLDATATSLDKVDKALDAQAESAQAAATASQANATATQAMGESAGEADARIKAMVQSSLERAAAEKAVLDASQRSTQATGTAATGVDRLVAAQNRSMQASTEMVRAEQRAAQAAENAAGITAQREELTKLIGQIDPTVAALERLDAQQAKLAQFRKSGALSDDDFKRYSAAIDTTRQRLGAADEAVSHFTLNSAGMRRELGFMMAELARGDISNFEGSLATLASRSGLLTTLMSPLGVAIGGVVASVGALGVAAVQTYEDEQRLNQAIAVSGNAAGVTMGSINQMATAIGQASSRVGEARGVLTELVATGKVGGESLQAMGQAALDMAELTGKSASEAARDVVALFDGTAAGAAKANEQYHFLNDATYEQIKALEEQGNKQEAVRVELEAFHASAGPRIEEMKNQVYGLASAWDAVKDATRDWWEEFKTGASLLAGTADLQTRIYALQGQKAGAQSGNPFSFSSWSPADERQLQDLQDKLAKQMHAVDEAAAQRRLDTNAVAGDAALDRLSASVDKATAKKQAIADLTAAFDKLWAGASPDNAKLAGVQRIVGADGTTSYAGGLYDTLRKDIDKKYAPPKGPHNPEPDAYNTFSRQVDALDVKTITADNAALTQYEQGIARLADQMAVYMQKGGDATKAADEFNRGQQALQRTLDQNHAREVQAQAEYAAALDKGTAALQLQVDNEVARIGMGAQEYDRSQRIARAYREEADALEKLALQRQAGINGEQGGLSQESYDADVAKLKADTESRIAILQDGFRRVDASMADWRNGFHDAFVDFRVQAADIADTVRDGFGGMYRDLNDDAVAWATGQGVSFKNVEKDFEQMLARMALQAAETAATNAFLDWIGFAAGSYASLGGSQWGSGNSLTGGGEYTGNQSLSTSWPGQPGRAEGGRITGPGTGTSDSILARLSNGENVITSRATDYYGQRFMDDVNAMRLPRFAQGGPVGAAASGGTAAASLPPIVNIYGADNGGRAESKQNGDGRWVIDAFINAAAKDVANNGRLGQAVNAVTGTRRPARSYAPVGS